VKIKHLNSGMTSRSAMVTLETDVERALSPSDLLLIVDNAKGIKYDRDSDSYSLTGESFGVARHFGGLVENVANPNDRKVTVYID
jgi:hypothetical protein